MFKVRANGKNRSFIIDVFSTLVDAEQFCTAFDWCTVDEGGNWFNFEIVEEQGIYSSYIPDMTNQKLKELGQSIFDSEQKFWADVDSKTEDDFNIMDCMSEQLDIIIDELCIRHRLQFLLRKGLIRAQ